MSLCALPCPQTPGHSALPTAETHESGVSGSLVHTRQPFLGTWRVCGLETQPSVLLTLSVVIPSPLSFLLWGCWENLGLLMLSFLFPNFVMFSGRFSQHCLLTWYHFRVVSSAPALPRLCVSGTRLAPLADGALLCLFLWFCMCFSWSPSFPAVFPRARGHSSWSVLQKMTENPKFGPVTSGFLGQERGRVSAAWRGLPGQCPPGW